VAAIPPIVALLCAVAGTLSPSTSDTLLTELRSAGSFQHAFRLTLDPQGGVYIADVELHQINHLTDDRSSAPSVGGFGWEAATFDRPAGLATDGLNLFVADEGNHRIQRFDRSLNFVSSFSTRDTSVAAARIGYPRGVALSRAGELYVLDGENLRVAKFRPTMQFDRSFGGIDDRRARLRKPLKILVGSDDHVYVLEPDRLVEFDMFGHFVRTIGEGSITDARSFAFTPGGFLILTGDLLQWFSGRGEQTGVILSRHLITEFPLGSLEDAVVAGEELYLLTTTRLHIFRVSFSVR